MTTFPTDPATTPPDRPHDSPHDGGDDGPDDGRSDELAAMRARLAAMAAPRDDDDADVAALRAVLRDERLMAQVRATVEQWPPLEEEQLAMLAALLTPRPRPPT